MQNIVDEITGDLVLAYVLLGFLPYNLYTATKHSHGAATSTMIVFSGADMRVSKLKVNKVGGCQISIIFFV